MEKHDQRWQACNADDAGQPKDCGNMMAGWAECKLMVKDSMIDEKKHDSNPWWKMERWWAVWWKMMHEKGHDERRLYGVRAEDDGLQGNGIWRKGNDGRKWMLKCQEQGQLELSKAKAMGDHHWKITFNAKNKKSWKVNWIWMVIGWVYRCFINFFRPKHWGINRKYGLFGFIILMFVLHLNNCPLAHGHKWP